jgi:pyruvate dehydrogenase E1 component beta subunit
MFSRSLSKITGRRNIMSIAQKNFHSSKPLNEMMTVRDSLRLAMSDEMRRDTNVFLMGEEVGEYNGAYKVSKGMHAEFGPERVVDTPITEAGFTGIGVGAGLAGLRPIIEFMTMNFSL